MISGGVVSTRVIVCVQVAVLPQSSVAVHVLVITAISGHGALTETSEKVSAGVSPSGSFAVGEPVKAGRVLAVHPIVTLAGQVMVGGISTVRLMPKKVSLAVVALSVIAHATLL